MSHRDEVSIAKVLWLFGNRPISNVVRKMIARAVARLVDDARAEAVAWTYAHVVDRTLNGETVPSPQSVAAQAREALSATPTLEEYSMANQVFREELKKRL